MLKVKSHIIWGIYPETEELIEQLQQQYEFDLITVVDKEAKKSYVKRQGKITYATSRYVEDARLSKVPEVHYHYVDPSERIAGAAWTVHKQGGLVH